MDEQLHLLTGAYALNALDNDERDAFERHALGAVDTREEVRGLSETAAMLAYGTPAVAPPPELKSKVMASIRNTRQLPVDAVVADLDTKRSEKKARSTTAVRWLSAAAGVLLVTTAALGGWAVGVSNDQERTEQRLQALAEQQSQVMSVLTAPDAKMIPGRMPDGAAVTIALSAQADKGAVITHDLPQLEQDRTYELWLISDEGAQPAGLIQGDAAGQTSMRLLEGVSDATHLGITVEPAGGSPQPTTDPIMLQEL
ncbi:anti-sigma factor [Arthrobacter crystallopoietes]|uniref:anti-sigma factor n=1 Tax=Crystallibacter crystallopoietes TaxID=37928 RepID=UPI0011115AAF|nr:anti-sigma factor [Arthrobacter crystallopoietes]QTG82691.1 anti-sigma factor [Arthrobacter crystallopoietes]